MARYGYARCSSLDQDTSIQIAALEKAGCDIIRSEKVSGTSRNGREELNLLMQFIRKGDTLVVTRIDRLARSIADLQDIIRELKAKGATLEATEQPINTSTSTGKMFVDLLGVFAEFETNLRKERQLEGVARAKALGKYRGRKPSVPLDEIRKLKAAGVGVTDIADKLGISRMSVYRAIGKGTRR